MAGWEKSLARVTHVLFYGLMLILPLSGWIMSSAGDWPLNWFGLVDIPKFHVTKQDPIVGIAGEGHEILGFLMLGLVILHIAAALRHHFVLKDRVLARMLG
jgi:cytochrome b561